MSEELSFHCPSCERKFVSKTGLLSHQRTFHGLKPLRAKKKKANWRVEAGRKGGLARGLRAAEKSLGFKCDLCNHKPFVFARSLGVHKYRIHGIEGTSRSSIAKRNSAVTLEEAIAALEVKISVTKQLVDELRAMQNA